MARPPVPQRIPPLRWRAPAFVWTPIGLALAIGWPAALFYNDAGLRQLIVIVSAAVFAFALVTLGVSWGLGIAPRTRRTVILHVLFAGFVASLIAPFALTRLLGAVADYQQRGGASDFSLSMSLAMTPLALMLGLPVALISAGLFAWTALTRPKPDEGMGENVHSMDVQPFR
jgi:hypothetical protein